MNMVCCSIGRASREMEVPGLTGGHGGSHYSRWSVPYTQVDRSRVVGNRP
jgi:hypothetical protein